MTTRRVLKNPDQRKRELLNIASSLFFEQGYERTTVNDILACAGMSKGGFYHHFTSKEELLEALAAGMAEQSVARFADILEEPNVDALTRLRRFLARAQQVKLEDAPQLRALFSALMKPENVLLHHRINAAVLPVVALLLARILAQGKVEGLFDVEDALATAEIVLGVMAEARQALFRAIEQFGGPGEEESLIGLETRLRAISQAVDRVLGIDGGNLLGIEPGLARKIAMAWTAK